MTVRKMSEENEKYNTGIYTCNRFNTLEGNINRSP
jgi:hypothetical protein